MSADNGIYLLNTPGENGREWRVCELMSIEDVGWDESINDYTDDVDVHIANARIMWASAPVFKDEGEAYVYAARLLRECYICEYGISEVTINKQF